MSTDVRADIEALLSWSTEHGSILVPPIEIYVDDISGISFRTTENIPSGTTLVTASYRTTLSWLNVITTNSEVVRAEDSFPKEFVEFFSQNDPNVIGHFFLIQQYVLFPSTYTLIRLRQSLTWM